MAELTLTRTGKFYGATEALAPLDLTVRDGEFLALLGPSGCGKTTLLRLLAGFEAPTQGRITIGTKTVADAATGALTPPEDRCIGMVFQSYALWPHMSVAANIAYPLKVRGQSKAAQQARVAELMALTGLADLGARRPADLSGGQRQRVALARSLAADPQAVLLDEPLANLDAALRLALQEVFAAFHARTRATMVYVTHDQSEAMAMADRIAVMDRGRILQVDSPQALYDRPRSRFVAGFIGAGAVLPVTPQGSCSPPEQRARFMGQDISLRCDPDQPPPSHICLRPENIALTAEGGLRTEVQRCAYLGGHYRLTLAAGDHQIIAHSAEPAAAGAQIGVKIQTPWGFYDPA